MGDKETMSISFGKHIESKWTCQHILTFSKYSFSYRFFLLNRKELKENSAEDFSIICIIWTFPKSRRMSPFQKPNGLIRGQIILMLKIRQYGDKDIFQSKSYTRRLTCLSHISHLINQFKRFSFQSIILSISYSFSFYKTGGPVFIIIGGEAAVSPSYVVSKFECIEWAKKHNAAIFTLEHRFYGQSHPTPDLSTENLQWLSSR